MEFFPIFGGITKHWFGMSVHELGECVKQNKQNVSETFAVCGVLENAKCNTSLTLRRGSLDQCGNVIFIVVKTLVQINFYTCYLHVCCFLIKEVGCFKILNLTFYLILCYSDPYFPITYLTKEDLFCSLHLEASSLLTSVCVTRSRKRAFPFLFTRHFFPLCTTVSRFVVPRLNRH